MLMLSATCVGLIAAMREEISDLRAGDMEVYGGYSSPHENDCTRSLTSNKFESPDHAFGCSWPYQKIWRAQQDNMQRVVWHLQITVCFGVHGGKCVLVPKHFDGIRPTGNYFRIIEH